MIEKKDKGIAFVSNIEEEGSRDDKEESLLDVMALLGKKFNNSWKYLDTKWRTNVQDKISNISPQNKK